MMKLLSFRRKPESRSFDWTPVFTGVAAFLLLTLFPGVSHAVPTPIYPILSDSGNAGDEIYKWGPDGPYSVSLSSTATNPPPPEGYYSMQSVWNVPTGTWAIMYLNGAANRSVDLSAYANGEIRFWANCTNDNFEVLFQHNDLDGTQNGYCMEGVFGGLFNVWVPVVLPIAPLGATLTDIDSPFVMMASPYQTDPYQPCYNVSAPPTCYIDNVRYVNPPVSSSEGYFSATVNNTSDQSSAGSLTWNSLSLPTGWRRSDQYIQIQTDVENSYLWGVQVYTNNTAAGANPKFTSVVPPGQIGSNPAGLVDAQQTSLTLPMAWSIKVGTQAPSAVVPTPAEPNDNGLNGHPTDLNAFQWMYMEDAKTPTITANGTNAFVNGDPFVTVKNNYGNHYTQGLEVPNDPAEFGAADTPNYIFLEANFGSAVTPQTYQTNSLILEFYNQ